MRKRIALTFTVTFGIGVLLYWYFQPGMLSYGNYLRIWDGMSVEDVNALLGAQGKEIPKSQVPRIVDWSVPVDSPKRLKTVIDGEKFYIWRQFPDSSFGGKYIIISTQGGRVKEKHYWEPSL